VPGPAPEAPVADNTVAESAETPAETAPKAD
jgi:exoribonuclease-2